MADDLVVTDVARDVTGMERLMAGLAHGSAFFSPILLPFLIWLIYFLLGGSFYVRHQAMQALLFHILVTLILTPVWAAVWALWALVLIGWPFAFALSLLAAPVTLWAIWVVLVATVRGFQGRDYRMPLVGGFVRPE